jgi:hypothetical protein
VNNLTGCTCCSTIASGRAINQAIKEATMSITKSGPLAALALLSALALCALAAPSIAQAGTGTTAYKCVFEGGTEDFEDASCKHNLGHQNGVYGHVPIATGTKTEIESESTLAKITLSGTIATIKAKVTCTGEKGTGFLTNEEPSAGNHTVTGSEITSTFTGCDMDLGKTEVTCSLAGGEVTVPSAKAMDVENAHGFAMGIKFEPEKGTTFATFTAGADCPSIANQTFSVTGSALGVPNGATMEFSEASTKSTLSLAGNSASYVNICNDKAAGSGDPIGATTTP